MTKNKTPKEIEAEKIRELAELLTRSAFDSQTDGFAPFLLFGLILGLGLIFTGFLVF